MPIPRISKGVRRCDTDAHKSGEASTGNDAAIVSNDDYRIDGREGKKRFDRFRLTALCNDFYTVWRKFVIDDEMEADEIMSNFVDNVFGETNANHYAIVKSN